MEGIAKQKVPGGKLLIVKVRYAERIEEVKILGDFFIYPESAVQEIEAGLNGIDATSSEESVAELVGQISKRCNAEMIGVNPSAIAQTLRAAMG
ncbi:MAG: biotin--protein ligase [Candidatus Micrarchaeota archaeon]|nr:biotin--protein ligase [Candidatus Micrarchaeota archaeon]